MNILLLDTDVVSFLMKGDSRANQYQDQSIDEIYNRSIENWKY